MGNGQTQDAVVLTGTGANAAFEVGVLQGLRLGTWGEAGNPPVQPFCYSGTSSGALNAAAMVSTAHLAAKEALDRLEDIWLRRIAITAGSATGLFRIRWDPTQYTLSSYGTDPTGPWLAFAKDALHVATEFAQRALLAASSSRTLPDGIVQVGEFCELLDTAPLRHLIREAIDTRQIAGNSAMCKLRITAVEWLSGAPRTFENRDFDTAWADNILVAAQALPSVVSPEMVDGIPYVDSCVLFDQPLKPAIDAAAKDDAAPPLVLHVIYVDSTSRDIPLPPRSNTFASLYRLYMLALSRSIRADITRADAVNKRLWMKTLLDTVIEASALGHGQVDTHAGEGDEPASGAIQERANRDLKGKRTLTIHRYAPKGHTHGFELRQFESTSIEQLIQHGKATALRHNCQEAGCILPDRDLPRIF
jgi:predicted acylesterase/phospholipase RssA